MKAHRSLLAALLICVGASSSDAALAAPKPKRVLRVCADPANLPYSNQLGQGFENQIAALVARELHAQLSYTWWPQRRGFFRNTLNAGSCDVVIGVPVGLPLVRSTQPYYRSTFAFVSRSDHQLGTLQSIDDPRLKALKVGVPLAGDDGANPAPAHALALRGIYNLTGFPLAESARGIPAAVAAVAAGSIDVALLWGPVAGAGAKKSPALLTVQPLLEQQDASLPFAFSIAMGVRPEDSQLARELDTIITRKRPAFTAILRRAGVPVLALPQGPTGARP